MASFDKFFSDLIKKEGGYVDNASDKGGPTNKGITLSTWRTYGHDLDGDGDIDKYDVMKITDADAYPVYKVRYWDKILGDKIRNQQVAEIVFDMYVNSGANAVKLVQRVLNESFGMNLSVDGGFGPVTLEALNSVNPAQFFNAYKQAREDYYKHLAATNPSQMVFLKGWLNRVDSFVYEKKK